MVRLSDTAALQILLLLGVFKARMPKGYTLRSAGLEFTEALQEVTTEVREGLNDNVGKLLGDAVYRSSKDGWIDLGVTKILNSLASNISESQDKVNEDRTLIDEIAEALRLPYVENRLGHINVERLQKLILTPSELKEAERSLDSSLACPGCGHKFASGEMATVRSWDRGARDVVTFTCPTCNTPSYIRCSEEGCENFVDAGKARIGRTHYCPVHASPKSIHEASPETIQAREAKATQELEDGIARRNARDAAARVRFMVDPNAPPQRGGGARTFRVAAHAAPPPNTNVTATGGIGAATNPTTGTLRNYENMFVDDNNVARIFTTGTPQQAGVFYAPAPPIDEEEDFVPEYADDDDDGGF